MAGLCVAAVVGVLFLVIPNLLLGIFGMKDATVLALGTSLLRYLALSGLFITVALCFTGGLQGTGDTRGPLYISIVSQIIVPLGLCAALQATRGLTAGGIWTAIVLAFYALYGRHHAVLNHVTDLEEIAEPRGDEED